MVSRRKPPKVCEAIPQLVRLVVVGVERVSAGGNRAGDENRSVSSFAIVELMRDGDERP